MTAPDERDRDYLWDRSGPVDPEIAKLEQAMAPLRHRAPLGLLPSRRPARRWPALAAGAGALAIAAALVLVWWSRRSDPATSPPVQASACARESGFRFDATAGSPRCGGDAVAGGWLPVGTWLETGAGESARIQIADIGEVQLAEKSRLSLVATGPSEHRLSLERGSLHAKVTAPPRLFVIDTPAATAVDLGCEYDLEVGPDGSGILTVTSGQVELADGDRLSVVPMGAAARTRGPGTPWALDASLQLRAAIDRFDSGDPLALDDIILLASARDTVTLWNLLLRVDGPGNLCSDPCEPRALLFDAIHARVPAPETVLREEIVRGDRDAIDRLRIGLEGIWMFPEMLDDGAPFEWGP